ncbi:hypothetical protein [Aquimarina macrocephali]|uniref:hypothetical protein n=1 Tax=Aquimarina macrocephali TaxID=666563 RepID=UPI0004BB22F5|nr:hypothetical protein [Aquimarina macrocephali]
MDILDISPLLSLILGVFLLTFILFRKGGLGKDKKIRFVLATIVSVYTLTALDYYFTINLEGDTPYSYISYLLTHLLGFFLYYFIVLFTNTSINLKKWLPVVVSYTILRWAFLYPLFQYETFKEYVNFMENSGYDTWIVWEYLLVALVNILLFILTFFKLKQSPLIKCI